jgi:hypothetical protein
MGDRVKDRMSSHKRTTTTTQRLSFVWYPLIPLLYYLMMFVSGPYLRLLLVSYCLLLQPANAFAPIARTVAHPILPQPPPQESSTCLTSIASRGIEMANLLYDDTGTAFDAWEWTANLGAPAALVAGAVLVTLSETREELAPTKTDKNWIRVAKQMCRFLLLSSFGLEVVSIFVSTVTGSCLLSHGPQELAKKMVGYTSPLGLLHHHHEFEYLTIDIGFLQGLFHWLGAVALEILIPKKGERLSARKMNAFMASTLVTLCMWILAFYNNHIPFYGDYGTMLRRYVVLFFQRYIFGCFRPMSLLYVPAAAVSAVLGWRAFNSAPDLDGDEEEEAAITA